MMIQMEIFTANYLDPDDDGDFIPTREEINISEEGTITFP